MQTSKFLRTFSKSPGLRYAAQAAAKEAPVQTTGIEVSRLPNGVIVASVDNQAPVARLAVAYRGSARNENEDNLGVSHCLRVLSDQSSQLFTGFGLVRQLMQQGASMCASSTRELTLYSLECLRDNVESVQEVFSAAASVPAFKPWEVADHQSRLSLELALMQSDPEVVLMEELHAAAFRNTLGRSLFAPRYMIGNYSPEMLQDFVLNNMTAGRCAVVGVGVEHSQAVAVAQGLQLPTGSGESQKQAQYRQGESRVQTGSNVVCAAIGVEGTSGSSREALAMAVLQQALGSGPSVKYSSGQSPLASAVARATSSSFAVSAFNSSYSDAGLFGVSLKTNAQDAGNVIRAAYGALKSVAQGVSEQDIKRAKAQLKSQLLFEEECSDSRALNIAARALLVDAKAAAASAESLVAEIDALQPSDVLAAAKKLSGTPSLAAVGNLKAVPYLHQLS